MKESFEFENPEIPTSKIIKELPPNVVMVEKPEAQFRIIYGRHNKTQQPEDSGKADALALEIVADYTNQQKAEELMTYLRRCEQYELLVKKSEIQNKPIFFADVTNPLLMATMKLGLPILELFVGFSLLGSLAKDAFRNKEMSRREFLKKTGKLLGGLYFSSNIYSQLMPSGNKEALINEKSRNRTVERFIIDLNEKIHPETDALILTLRNHVIAQKLETIAEKIKKSEEEKPEVAVVMGSAHIGIERALQKKDQERTALVDKLLSVPGNKENREKIATIARLDYDEKQDKWLATEIFKDPHLAGLEKK